MSNETNDELQTESYVEFQRGLLNMHSAIVLMQDQNGNVAWLTIQNTWATAFPPKLFSQLNHFAILPSNCVPLVDQLPRADTVCGVYEGCGPFTVQLNYVSADYGFKLSKDE